MLIVLGCGISAVTYINFYFAAFVPSQSTEPTFCPGTSYPGSMDSLSIDDPRSWVFTPMGTAAGTAAETSGTYSITGPLGLLEACRLSDPPQSLVISVDQQRLDGIFGEATVTFTSGSGSTTTFVVSYGMLLALFCVHVCSLWLQLHVCWNQLLITLL